ncbi:ExbD/TolR family protein [Haloferula sp. A504]|jgi:biopolymer transport protein ExbD|uniref:ExbD/TolR family protein n=1 Tax=Haloferula sp. A504 TaxID=3373601 RepID=UPI0031C44911|nr:biopolymer transporter ExbD [Verrucomicrobiaceae bacterium E54]
MKKHLQRRKRRSVPVPIASMGDIAFLLIIFFMVCSEVSKDNSKARLTLPFSEFVEKIEIPVAARIAVDENGEIFFDGYQVDSVKEVEMGVRALLTKTVSDDQRHVQFKCDAQLTKEQFEPVIKAIAAGGGIIEAVGENNE